MSWKTSLLTLLAALVAGGFARSFLGYRGQKGTPTPTPQPPREIFKFPIAKERVTLRFAATWANVYTPANPHKGVDVSPFAGSAGQPVYSPINGRILFTGFDNGLGNYIKIQGKLVAPSRARNLAGQWVMLPAGATYEMVLAHHSKLHVVAGQSVADWATYSRYWQHRV